MNAVKNDNRKLIVLAPLKKIIVLHKNSITMKILFFIGCLLYVLSECGNSLFGKGKGGNKFKF